MDRLRRLHEQMSFEAEIHRIHEDIDRFLDDDKLNPSEQARDAFNDWRSECRRILRKAAVLEVDGCWYLWGALTSSVTQSTAHGVTSSAFLSSGLGCAALEWIGAAADSMADWVADTESYRESSSATQRKGQTSLTKRRGKPPEHDPVEDDKIVDAWHSSGCRTYEEFATKRGMQPRHVKRAIDRHRKKQPKRRNK